MTQPLALDANLCILWVAGTADIQLLGRHKALGAYDAQDFEELVSILNSVPSIQLCPHVLTEASNLLRQTDIAKGILLSGILKLVVERYGEQATSSLDAIGHTDYLKLGLTDAVLMLLAQSGSALLTADRRLYQAASLAGYKAVNFNHLREQRYRHDWRQW